MDDRLPAITYSVSSMCWPVAAHVYKYRGVNLVYVCMYRFSLNSDARRPRSGSEASPPLFLPTPPCTLEGGPGRGSLTHVLPLTWMGIGFFVWI